MYQLKLSNIQLPIGISAGLKSRKNLKAYKPKHIRIYRYDSLKLKTKCRGLTMQIRLTTFQ